VPIVREQATSTGHRREIVSAAGGTVVALVLVEALARLGPRFFHAAAGRESPDFQVLGLSLVAVGVGLAWAVYYGWSNRGFSWALAVIPAVAYLPMALNIRMAFLTDTIGQRIFSSFGETALVVFGATLGPALRHLALLTPMFASAGGNS